MAAAIPVVGSFISAYGAQEEGKTTSQSLNAQADLQLANAKEALAKGASDANRQQIFAGKKIGAMESAYGASGVSSDSGSVMSAITDSVASSEMDRLNILHGADIRAINYENQAALDKYGAESAIKGSYWKALGYLTQGAVKYVGNQSGATTPIGGGNEAYSQEEANNVVASEGMA